MVQILRMIICKRPDPQVDHLQEAGSSGRSFAKTTTTTTTTVVTGGGHQSDRDDGTEGGEKGIARLWHRRYQHKHDLHQHHYVEARNYVDAAVFPFGDLRLFPLF